MQFQNGFNKVQFWSEIIRMISDQIALHPFQLPLLNVLNKHAAILKIFQCAGCNIKNIAVCRLQLLKILQPVLGNLM